MNSNLSKGSEWGIWDLQVQTIIDDSYVPLSDYYTELKEADKDKWQQFIDKVGGEENAIKFDSKEYFNNNTIDCKERCNNYVRTVFSFLSVYKPQLSLIGITDHNYYHEYLIDSFLDYSKKNALKVIGGTEINVEGVHMLVFFERVPYNKPSFSEGIKTFLSKINVHSRKANGALTISSKSITDDVVTEIIAQDGIYIYAHCNSNNGLFQERGKTDRTHLSNIFNQKDKILLQGISKNNINKTKEYIHENPNLFKSLPIFLTASDSRSLRNYGDPDTDGNFQWVKADKTFNGLLQILNEPDRLYIGAEPELFKRLKMNPTKFIDKLIINKNADSTVKEQWFENTEVSFNYELVAIIGNKGKGKSALADILGLCGNSHNMGYVSFLTKDKFKKPTPRNLAKEFNATIVWKSGVQENKILNDDTIADSFERVKYIPQSFLELLCTDVDKKVFEEELEKVIFSRLDESQKLNKGSLKEIINYQKELLENSINNKKSEVRKINTKIVELEAKNIDSFRQSVKESIQQKSNELESHLKNKPFVVNRPADSDDEIAKTKKITDEIQGLRTANESFNNQISQITANRTRLQINNTELNKIKDTYTQLESTIDKVINDTKGKIEEFGLNVNNIISYQINTSGIDKLVAENDQLLRDLVFQIASDNPENIPGVIEANSKKIVALQAELDGPSREYQKYLTEVNVWEQAKNDIEGSETKEGSLRYYKKLDDYIRTELTNELNQKRSERTELVKAIFRDKLLISNIYKDLYKPVTEFIIDNKNELSDYNVNIDVTLQLAEFEDRFFSYVSNGNAGSFYGTSEGRARLESLTEIVNWNDQESVVNFLNQINESLHFDKRVDQKDSKRELRKQLKGGFKELDFYDFLYSLDYLESSYQLKLGDKTLSALSPGERGALLLIFYLLLDKDDIPIIIDQPEENLDNQSVYKILVHFIKQAKKRRQIIIVTHNPNLAVVCDAEQIIRTDIDKTKGNLFNLKGGAIEDLSINAEIVDVLEGTRPAFNNRTVKYKISQE